MLWKCAVYSERVGWSPGERLPLCTSSICLSFSEQMTSATADLLHTAATIYIVYHCTPRSARSLTIFGQTDIFTIIIIIIIVLYYILCIYYCLECRALAQAITLSSAVARDLISDNTVAKILLLCIILLLVWSMIIVASCGLSSSIRRRRRRFDRLLL